MNRDPVRTALRSAAVYALLAALWIVFTDWALGRVVPAPSTLTRLETLKGWAFVGVTAVMLFLLMRRELARVRQAEQAMRESEAKFHALFEQSADATLLLGAGNVIVDCNMAAVRLLGAQRKAQLVGQYPWSFSPQRQPDGLPSTEKAEQIFAAVEQTGMGRFEWLHQRLDGKLTPVDATLATIHIDGERLLHVSLRDLTERKQLEATLRQSSLELAEAYQATLAGWSKALELRDQETEGHSQRVTALAMKLAEVVGLNPQELVHTQRGALLHDVGKMGIPDTILQKPDKLTAEEWTVMRQHPVYAYEMLKPIAYLHPALVIPYLHHEWWNGRGYPLGLKGEQIPLAARIFAIVDVWDALLSDRPYRPAWSREKALAYIRSLRGEQFDPQVTDVFLEMVKEGEGW